MKKSTRRTRTRNTQRTIPPSAALRTHLDTLWHPATLAAHDDTTLQASLDSLTAAIQPLHALPIMLAAYGAVAPEHRPRIETTVITWLQTHDAGDVLTHLICTHRLTAQQTEHALQWLSTLGIDISELPANQTHHSFYRAYYYRDTTQQAELFLCFYPDHRRRTLQILDFLIDHNPPWHGAIKEFAATRPRKPQDAIRDLMRFWHKNRPEPLLECDAETMGAIVGHALLCNRTSGIRLPTKMEAWRDDLVTHVLPWIPADEMPEVSSDLLDSLLRQGQQPELLRAYEERVGYYLADESGQTRFIPRTADPDHVKPNGEPPEEHRSTQSAGEQNR